MFGGDMMQKLQEMQRQVEESKKKLNDVKVEEIVEGKVSIKANGNRVVENLEILGFEDMEKEELEDLLILAINGIIEKSGNVHDAEMANSAKGMLPGM